MDIKGFMTKDGTVHRYDYHALANKPEGSVGAAMDYDRNVRAINHRGFRTLAPENTIPAYILSKVQGFTCVECDVSFTADGVCVLLHDPTIDRTSNGSGKISSLTYAQASQYDYGSWKSEDYAGTGIPTLKEFLCVCKGLGLHPYIEIKNESGTTQAMVDSIVTAVQATGMKGRVTYISYNSSYLGTVKALDPEARLGYVVEGITSTEISMAKALKQDANQVFLNVNYSKLTDAMVDLCIRADVPLEVWNCNSESWIENMNPYITGVTSDTLIAGKILYNKCMNYEQPEAVSLTEISATYRGASVAVGTALSALHGIDVTAYYSDGSQAAVSGYTLSGTIAEGENTITVSYAGKTAFFTVTGVAESPYYTVTNTLTNAVSSNPAQSVAAGESYTAELTGAEGYVLSGGYVTVEMGGNGVTAGTYGDGRISIPEVTGNIEITAEAVLEAPAVPEGYEAVRTLYSNDLQYQKGSQYQNTTSDPPYTVQSSMRVGYLYQDIPVEYGYSYRVDFVSKYDTAQYSMQLITQAGLELMASGAQFSGGGTPNAQVYDTGWLASGAEVEIPGNHNGSPCVAMRLAFRRSAQNEAVAAGDIQSVTVSRKRV